MSHLNLEAVLGLDQLEYEQEKARAEEERTREQELKEILARELPEDLLDDLSDTSSEVSEIIEDPIPQLVGHPTHHLRVEGISRNTPRPQQPDSHSQLDEQFFHSSQILVSTPNPPKEASLAPTTKESLAETAPLSQGAGGEELLRLRILNEARASEIRSLQIQMQQLQAEYRLQVSQLSAEVMTQREDISISSQHLRESQTQAGLSHAQLTELERKLAQSERQCEALRGENLRMSEELQNALTHLDNCKSQLETLCKADVIDRLREQHLSLIQQSETDHLVEVREVREEMEAVTHSYQETIRQMDADLLEQRQASLQETDRLIGELRMNRGLLEQLRVEAGESELRARVERLESEMSEGRQRECQLEDEKRQLELMLGGLRNRCSEAERENDRVCAERDETAREWMEKASEGEADRKESLEKCRAACLQLHEESCNRLRQKSAQEQRLLKELHEREKERLCGEVDGLKRGLAESGERVSVLETAASEKEARVLELGGELAERERTLREKETCEKKEADSAATLQASEVLEEQVEAREAWRYQGELRNQWHEWSRAADREKKDLAASHDVVVKKYQLEISHLREHISNLESELSETVSAQKPQREPHTPSETRAEIYNYTLEAVHDAFTEVLGTRELTEALPSPLHLPLAEYSPTETTGASEFPSLLSSYLQQTLLSVVQPLCAEKRAAVSSADRLSSEQSSRVQEAVTQALRHAKQQYLKSFSDLKASLNAKFSEKMAGLNGTWDQERITLSEELDESREACQLLRRRVRECEHESEVVGKKQVEQLSLLKQKLSDTDTDMEIWHDEKNSLSEELERSTEACQQLIKKIKDMNSAAEKEKKRHLEELSLLKQQLRETDTLLQERTLLSEELDASKEVCRQLKKKLRDLESASEKEKRKQIEELSLLKQKLSVTGADAEVWHHERIALQADLERSSEAYLQLKPRLEECELASEREKRKQMEQLSLLKQKITETEVAHKKSVQALRQKFKKQIRETRDASFQADAVDKRYKELFERALTNLRRETEGLMKKKLAIIEESRRVELENTKKMVENNDHFLRRCKQVMDSGKKQTIQDYHSST